MQPIASKRKVHGQQEVYPSLSGREGSSSNGMSPGFRKGTLGGVFQLGNKEALPARTFDEAREDEIIGLIEEHQRMGL